MTPPRAGRVPPWLPLAVIVLIGLVMRIAGSQGGLWLDEAWSAQMAHDVATPIGVFTNINHDNNHHLTSLWLQFVGYGAPPLAARALSVVTGTAAIVAAAWVTAPQGRVAMLVTAWLFAVSPMLVTLGSEARGYAPMSLALLIAIGLVDRRLQGDDRPLHVALSLCFVLGALSQLTMVFGVFALIGWYALTLWRRDGMRVAATATVRSFAIPLLALLGALALIFVPALLSTTGFQIGRYDPFDLLQFLHGVVEMIGYTFAVPIVSVWLLVAVVTMVILARAVGATRIAFVWLAVVAFPLALVMVRSGNVAHPRYYLVAGLALLLLLGQFAAIGWRRGKLSKLATMVVVSAFSCAALTIDIDLARNRRGDPVAAVDAMRMRAPDGATLILDRPTGSAMIAYAAAMRHYRVVLQDQPCPAQRFTLLDRFRGEAFPATLDRCGARYLPILGRRARGLSGTHWTLYERRP